MPCGPSPCFWGLSSTVFSLRRLVCLAGSRCEPVRTLWDSGHVHSWVPHVLVLFRERILYHDDVGKRGSAGLLVHRSKRIVLPFFVLGLLIFPMLNNMKALADWVGEGREERVAETSEDKETEKPKYEVPDDLGGAARQGDLDAIVKFLNEGADIDGRYDKDFTPLHWAAAMGKAEAVNLLAEKGADLNARDQAQSTPVLVAAFWAVPNAFACFWRKEPTQSLETLTNPVLWRRCRPIGRRRCNELKKPSANSNRMDEDSKREERSQGVVGRRWGKKARK